MAVLLYCLNLLPIFSPIVTITNGCTYSTTIFCASCLCVAWQPLSCDWSGRWEPTEWPAWCPILTPYHLYLWSWWVGTTDFRYYTSLPLHFL